MDRAQAQAYKNRYSLLNRISREEARKMPAKEKLRQLAIRVSACVNLGWSERMQIGEGEIRQRWIQLKKTHA